jgi:quercetin dioxygenase-like cupin family protein
MHTYPYKIENGSGEELVFLGVVPDEAGERLKVEIRAQPGAGPPMHVHHLQEEAMTVVSGKLGFQTLIGKFDRFRDAPEPVQPSHTGR